MIDALADPVEVARRRAALSSPAMAPFARFVAGLRGEGRAVPDADPCDGGTEARVLLLLERPGRAVREGGFVSRDNATPTARNIRRFAGMAGLPRSSTLIWNVVPWLDEDQGPNLAPRTSAIEAGLATLPAALDLLVALRVVVFAGRIAALAEPAVRALRPEVRLLHMPHPSPTIVCTDPRVGQRIVACLQGAAALRETSCPGRATFADSDGSDVRRLQGG